MTISVPMLLLMLLPLNLQEQGCDSYILDLRNNPGGLVRAGLDIARLWLPGEASILTVEGRDQAGSPAIIQVASDSRLHVLHDVIPRLHHCHSGLTMQHHLMCLTDALKLAPNIPSLEFASSSLWPCNPALLI